MVGQMGRGLVLAFALVLALPAQADYEAGQHAWDAGRPVEALEQWQAAADDGDRQAMLALGRLYATGLGAPQNFILAHMWFNLAASRGEVEALAERDVLAAKMTPQQIADAQQRATAWHPGGDAASDARESAFSPARVETEDSGPPPVEALREAQALLAALGYDPGPADAIWGRRSVQAYLSFLRDAGQPLTEMLTPQALHAMRAIVERQGVEADVATGGETPPSAATVSTQPALPPDALHRAAQTGHLDGLKAALEADADVDARDGQGWTALMHAANKGYTLLVPLLLEAKADPDVRAPDGATALFMAAVHGHSEIIALLMKAGADTSLKGPKGKTAGDVARVKYGGLDIAQENDERAEVLELIQSGRPTRNEIERTRQKAKQAIELNLLKCRYAGVAVTHASFSADRLEIHNFYQHSDPGTYAQSELTFELEDVETSAEYKKNFRDNTYSHFFWVVGNILYKNITIYKGEVYYDETTMVNEIGVECDKRIVDEIVRGFDSLKKITSET